MVLWGDGRHDDTTALNAWFRGEGVIWAGSGDAAPATIAGHSFRLSAAVYAPAGSGRTLADFRMLWPERGERVTGGTIRTGSDPDAAPVVSGVRIEGGDSGEGIPFDAPDIALPPDPQASCATS